jgi:hypothetical protein
MAEPDLRQTSLADLIVELLLDGRGGHVVGLLPFEPVSVTALLTELHRRTGQDLGADPQAWRAWFLSAYPSDEVGRLRLEYAETRRRIREIERRAQRRQRR